MKKSFVLVVSGILSILASATQAAPLANAKILELGGKVTIHHGENVASAIALNVGDILAQGDVITTSSQSTAKIAFSNGSIIDLSPNSQLELQIVKQKSYKGLKYYQQLDRDPSQSITLLNMNYGSLAGHVKKLTAESKFNIKTPLGVTIIKGTRFRVSFSFDPISNDFRFLSNNIDGMVDVITASDGENIDYGMQSDVQVKLATDPNSSTVKIPIPPAHIITVTLPANDPYVEDIVNFEKNLAPDVTDDVIITPPAKPPVITDPDDSEIPSGATNA